jgi:tartrate dehydrogenase/decarboxylase/D-malate dehydrogenase
MLRHKIAVIPGDGIGKEVIPAGVSVLRALDLNLHFDEFPWGSDYFRETGKMMPEDGLEILRNYDAIYFGAVGDPGLPDDLTLWGLRLRICQGFDQYANVRPTRILPGIVSSLRNVNEGDIDWVIVR